MKPFLPINTNDNIPSDKIDSYISYMSQVYNVQQYMLIQAQNQIMQAQLLKLQSGTINYNAILQQKIIKLLEQILQKGVQISIKDFIPQSKMPILAKYIANIFIYLMKQCSSDQDEVTLNYIKDPNSIVIDQKQWDLICEIISKKLVCLGANDIFCTNDSQIGIVSQSLLFSSIIRKVIFKKLHGNTQQISFQTLNDLLGQENRSDEFLYKFLCEEDKNTMTKQSCQISLEKMFQKSNQYFYQSNLIEQIIENQKQFTINGNFEYHAQKYLNIIKIYQNCDQNKVIEQIVNGLFLNQQQIDSKQFIFNSNRLEEKLKKILFMFVDLVRIENSIIQIVLENKISEEPQKNPLEYYAKLIERIKNKCRSKEDEFCNCKRCQCIKRNRDSAREAQKRKREALEKIGPLQEEYQKINKKVKLLEFDNSKLKAALFEALRNPVIENIIKTQYQSEFSNLTNIMQQESQDRQKEDSQSQSDNK
ncbi:unnamed protein product [Paramecium pentaurelia]|uniref:BZIP domain-containing protein n=1 Tax=Paramecium pentaurelia TaxID=43138 RepID=A0A8S1UMI4_9CILI|nr:unnamed protein product [Paramecium pentaurelia]